MAFGWGDFWGFRISGLTHPRSPKLLKLSALETLKSLKTERPQSVL